MGRIANPLRKLRGFESHPGLSDRDTISALEDSEKNFDHPCHLRIFARAGYTADRVVRRASTKGKIPWA